MLTMVLEMDILYFLRAHEIELLKHYPDQVPDMCDREVNRATQNITDHSTYQQWVRHWRI